MVSTKASWRADVYCTWWAALITPMSAVAVLRFNRGGRRLRVERDICVGRLDRRGCDRLHVARCTLHAAFSMLQRCMLAMLQCCTVCAVLPAPTRACARGRPCRSARCGSSAARRSISGSRHTAPKTQTPKRGATIDGSRKPGWPRHDWNGLTLQAAPDDCGMLSGATCNAREASRHHAARPGLAWPDLRKEELVGDEPAVEQQRRVVPATPPQPVGAVVGVQMP